MEFLQSRRPASDGADHHTYHWISFPNACGERESMAKGRTDAERRARQCERLSRLLRVLHLIMGPGRWDAESLAGELECSRRTIHRLLQTLSMAGVPWYYDESRQAYRVRNGFKFPAFESSKQPTAPAEQRSPTLNQPAMVQVLKDGEALMTSLKKFLRSLRKITTDKPS